MGRIGIRLVRFSSAFAPDFLFSVAGSLRKCRHREPRWRWRERRRRFYLFPPRRNVGVSCFVSGPGNRRSGPGL